MHHMRTGEVIHAGIHPHQAVEWPEREKGIARLLGYLANVVTDATIHLMVELKVAGPDTANNHHRRQCELHQKAHNLQSINLGCIGLFEYLASVIYTREAG